MNSEFDCRVYYHSDYVIPNPEQFVDVHGFEENNIVFLRHFAENKLSEGE